MIELLNRLLNDEVLVLDRGEYDGLWKYMDGHDIETEEYRGIYIGEGEYEVWKA